MCLSLSYRLCVSYFELNSSREAPHTLDLAQLNGFMGAWQVGAPVAYLILLQGSIFN